MCYRHIIENSFVRDNVVTQVSIILKDIETIGHVIISLTKLIKIALVLGQKNYTNTFILYFISIYGGTLIWSLIEHTYVYTKIQGSISLYIK